MVPLVCFTLWLKFFMEIFEDLRVFLTKQSYIYFEERFMSTKIIIVDLTGVLKCCGVVITFFPG